MKAKEINKEQQMRCTIIKMLVGLVVMFAFAFALVPLYQLICDITGLNGNTSNLKQVEEINNIDEVEIDTSRKVRLQFVAINNKHVPVKFDAVTTETTLHPGEIKTYHYKLKNLTNKNMVVQAVPSVSPNLASSYLRKIECFCFSAQPLAPNEEAELFVNLYIHKKLPQDIGTLTLAYSLFDITDTSDFEKLSDATSIAGRGEPSLDPSKIQLNHGNDDGNDDGHDEHDGHDH